MTLHLTPTTFTRFISLTAAGVSRFRKIHRISYCGRATRLPSLSLQPNFLVLFSLWVIEMVTENAGTVQ